MSRATGAPPEPELIVADDGRSTGTLGSAEADAALVAAATEALRRGLSRTVELGGRSLFIEAFPVRPRLVIVGGVEVARSLVRLAGELGYETVVVDGRAAFATPERFPDVDRLIIGWPDEVADEIGLGPNDAVAVLSHDAKFDEPAIVEALRRGAATSARSVRARRRPTGARGCSRPASTRRTWPGCTARSGWTSAAGRRPRRRSRSSPRSSPTATAAPAAPMQGTCGRASDGPVDVAAIVLAAGAGQPVRWRQAARVAGRPAVLQHVLDALADGRPRRRRSSSSGPTPRRSRPRSTGAPSGASCNPDPARGLASSLQRRAWRRSTRGADAVLVALGDQPLIRADAIRRSLAAPLDPSAPVVAPRYAGAEAANPVRLRRAAFDLGGRGRAAIAGSDRSSRRIPTRPEVDVAGDNPDVDTPADLAALAERAWADRVRANREQVDRFREAPDGTDFYAPVRSMFRDDPTRTDDPVLDGPALEARARRHVAGHRRRRRPVTRSLALRSRRPARGHRPRSVAVDARRRCARSPPSTGSTTSGPSRRAGRPPRRPLRPPPGRSADVALIAHVGYDVEAIGPFVDAMEAARRRASSSPCSWTRARRRPPTPFWPPVHGEARVALPALPEFVELLRARGRRPIIERVTDDRRRFESRDAVEAFVRRQLWIDAAGPKEERLQAAMADLVVPDGDGWAIWGRGPVEIGIVRWAAS